MLSWPLIRNTCLALLLLPIAHFAWVVGSEHGKRQTPGPQVWQEDVDAYTREAQNRPLPEQALLVTGGRQARLWTGLDSLLAPRPVLMRGLGDAIVDDLIHHHSALIGYYRPASLVLLVDHNEFRHRDDKTPEELLLAIQQLIATDRSYDVTRHHYLIGPIKAPFYPEDHERIEQTNALLAEWAARDREVTYLDPGPVLENAQGQPDGSYYRPGGQHLNRQGYLRLGVLLRAAVEARESHSTGIGSQLRNVRETTETNGSSVNAP